MANGRNPRRVPRAAVHAKPLAITSSAECSRWYGSDFKTKPVNGTVLDVIIDRSSGRAGKSLLLEWTLSPSENVGKRLKILKLCNIKAGTGPVDDNDRSGDKDVPVTPILRLTHRQPSEDSESDDVETSPLPAEKPANAAVHGVELFEQDVLCPISSVRNRYDWFVCTPSGDTL